MFVAKIVYYLDIIGLTWFVPLVEMCRPGADRGFQARRLLRMAGLPLLAIGLALLAWQWVASMSKTGVLHIPGPGMVLGRLGEMVDEWKAEGGKRQEYEAQLATALAENPEMSRAELLAAMPYDRKPTFLDPILVSLETVFTGVGLAILVAVPIGILCGLSSRIYEMANPFIQVFKPISPLAWFPVVFIFVNTLLSAPPPGSDAAGGIWSWIGGLELPKPFIIAAVVVSLCTVWPTLINTANGVANVDKDYLNVAKVLNLNWFQKVWRIILPSSLPYIFTGMRLSLGIGWMVLIAAEMMAVSPGLGGFIWNWYQSSNEASLSYLLLAVITIGFIGFLLDRAMISAQKMISHGNPAAIR